MASNTPKNQGQSPGYAQQGDPAVVSEGTTAGTLDDDGKIVFPAPAKASDQDTTTNHHQHRRHHHHGQDLFSPPRTVATARGGDDTEMMGPILRRKKVVSMPLGAGGDFFYSNAPPPVTAFDHYAHPGRRKQRSEGVEALASTKTFFDGENQELPKEPPAEVRQKRRKQFSGGAGGGLHKDRFLTGVIRRKQVSLDLLGPNDFFAISEDELLEPTTMQHDEADLVEDEVVAGDEEVSAEHEAGDGTKKIFRPLRFAPPLVRKDKKGGGGHGGGHGGGGRPTMLGPAAGLATIDEEVVESFRRYSSATIDLEKQAKLLQEKLEQGGGEIDKQGKELLNSIRESMIRSQSVRKVEGDVLKAKLLLSIEEKEGEDGGDPASKGKTASEVDDLDDIYFDDGIIRAGRCDKIKAGVMFVLMFCLTIVVCTWNTHIDESSFIILPVGLACTTNCEGNLETLDFFRGHNHFSDGEVIRLIMHLDPNEEAAREEERVICEIVGEETGEVKATVEFDPPDAEERKTMEKRITVDFDHASEPHVINVNVDSQREDVHLGFTLDAKTLTPLAQHSELVGALVMLLVYIFILIEVVHRTLVAVIGSMIALMLLFIMSGGETESIQHIMLNLEWSTLGLLFGMMLLVGELSHTGVFEYCAVRLLIASKGSFVRLMVLLCSLTAVASAFLDNVTTMLLVAPVTIDMCHILNVDPRPYLIGEVLLSNIGGTATLIGDPPNIIIGSSFEEISFVGFITEVLPCIFLFCFPASICIVVWIYRYYLTSDEMKVLDTKKLKRTYAIYDEPRLLIAGTATFFVILMFFLHPIHHTDTAWIALLGAFATICFTNPHDIQDPLRNHVEWDTLLFFAGLFILVEACAAMGLLKLIGDALADFIEQQPEEKQTAIAITLIIWVSAITSAFLDNIPFTITLIPVLQTLGDSIESLDITTLAWALSFGVCLGGNGTLLGASANIVTAGISTNKGYEISFLNFLYPGMVVMICTVAISNLYMLVRYAWI